MMLLAWHSRSPWGRGPRPRPAGPGCTRPPYWRRSWPPTRSRTGRWPCSRAWPAWCPRRIPCWSGRRCRWSPGRRTGWTPTVRLSTYMVLTGVAVEATAGLAAPEGVASRETEAASRPPMRAPAATSRETGPHGATVGPVRRRPAPRWSVVPCFGLVFASAPVMTYVDRSRHRDLPLGPPPFAHAGTVGVECRWGNWSCEPAGRNAPGRRWGPPRRGGQRSAACAGSRSASRRATASLASCTCWGVRGAWRSGSPPGASDRSPEDRDGAAKPRGRPSRWSR